MIRRIRTLLVCLILATVSLGTVGCKKKIVKDPELSEQEGAQEDPEEAARAKEKADADMRDALLALQRVHFAFDSSELNEDSRTALGEAAQKLIPRIKVHLYVEGHADAAGETEYNLTLGEKRAKAVSGYLEKMGVAADRLHIVSYGEEVPLKGGESADAMAANRRVDFKLMRGDVELVLEDSAPIK